jgi:hypothetical protein
MRCTKPIWMPPERDPVALERRFRATTRETVRRIRKRREGAAGEQDGRLSNQPPTQL